MISADLCKVLKRIALYVRKGVGATKVFEASQQLEQTLREIDPANPEL